MKIILGLIFVITTQCVFAFDLVHVQQNPKKGMEAIHKAILVLPDLGSPQIDRAEYLIQDALTKMGIGPLVIINYSEFKFHPEKHILYAKIVIGSNPDYLVFGPEDFGIKSKGNLLFLDGGNKKGIVYAVTTFVEDYLHGYVFSPTEFSFPSWDQKSTISIPDEINRVEHPAFAVRMVNGSYNDSEWYKDYRKLYSISDLWLKGYYVHTFNKLIDPKIYFENHPEYFSMVGGKRIPYGQLCLSNQEVVKTIIENLGVEIQNHPEIKIWSVSQNDCYYQCECSECKKIDEEEGSPSGAMLRLVNEVAQNYPNKIITTLAYQYTRKPPRITRPVDNVWVTLCSIELDRSKSMVELASSQSFVDDLKGWSELGGGKLKIWDYTVQFTNYLCPFPNLDVLQPNIQLFSKNNVSAVFEQGNAKNGVEWAQLKSYLISQWLWNPNASKEDLQKQFIDAYYGPASFEINQYISLLNENARKSGIGLDIYGNPAQYKNAFLSTENIADYQKIFQDALEKTKLDSAFHARVWVAYLPVMYSILEISKTDLFGTRGWYTEQNGKWLKRQDMVSFLDTFHQKCLSTGSMEFDENGMNAEKYYQETLKATQVTVDGNLAFHQKINLLPLSDPRYTGEGASRLTDGVHGTTNWKLNWLGWEGKDLVVELDLNKSKPISFVSIGTLNYPKSWITYPNSIKAEVLLTNGKWQFIGENNQRNASDEHAGTFDYVFHLKSKTAVSKVRLTVNASKQLPEWHPYHGNKSWLFIDEVEVR